MFMNNETAALFRNGGRSIGKVQVEAQVNLGLESELELV